MRGVAVAWAQGLAKHARRSRETSSQLGKRRSRERTIDDGRLGLDGRMLGGWQEKKSGVWKMGVGPRTTRICLTFDYYLTLSGR